MLRTSSGSFSGEILSGDLVVATVTDNQVVTTPLAPLYLRKTGDLEDWLRMRSVDLHRPNSRILKKMLRLQTSDEVELVKAVHGVCITDDYWLRAYGEDLCYAEVRFTDDTFSEVALTGTFAGFELQPEITPELTNIGSFEKCWKRVDGRWVLNKANTPLEKFSELFTCALGKKLGFAMAEYDTDRGYTVCPNFVTAGINYEPAASLMFDDESYPANIAALQTLSCPRCPEQYLQILFLDTVVLNPDRHTLNYGYLRRSGSGEILSMAPNFDNNLALVARGYANPDRPNDLMARLFNEVWLQLDRPFTLPVVERGLLEEAFTWAQERTEISIDRDYVIRFCLSGYSQIRT